MFDAVFGVLMLIIVLIIIVMLIMGFIGFGCYIFPLTDRIFSWLINKGEEHADWLIRKLNR